MHYSGRGISTLRGYHCPQSGSYPKHTKPEAVKSIHRRHRPSISMGEIIAKRKRRRKITVHEKGGNQVSRVRAQSSVACVCVNSGFLAVIHPQMENKDKRQRNSVDRLKNDLLCGFERTAIE